VENKMKELAISNYRILTPFTSPWPFSVVDNFLSADTYKRLCSIMMQDHLYKPVDYWTGKTVSQKAVSGSSIKASIPVYSDHNLTQLIKQDVVLHLEEMLPDPFWVMPDIVRCDPNYVYGPHKDHPSKFISIIVYLYPEKANGTVIKSNGEDFEIKWRPNRAFVFENSKHGIHWYNNKLDEYRYTLNIYITTDGTQPFIVINK
jgi:hypothetical protein